MNNIRLLYIDLFCGAGGTSTGVEKANYKGRKCAKVITQADQKKFIGNAVEVNIARVLCEALVEEIVDELLKVA